MSDTIIKELLDIMFVYHQQEDRGNIDTPGGLEHMGDVWRLLLKWEEMAKSERLAGAKTIAEIISAAHAATSDQHGTGQRGVAMQQWLAAEVLDLRRYKQVIESIKSHLKIVDSLDALCCIERAVYDLSADAEKLLDSNRRVNLAAAESAKPCQRHPPH